MSGLTNVDEIAAVMRNPELSIGARLLWWELNQWVSDDLRVCFPTQKRLAENLGVSRASIIRWLQELRAESLIDDVPRRYGNAYALTNGASPE